MRKFCFVPSLLFMSFLLFFGVCESGFCHSAEWTWTKWNDLYVGFLLTVADLAYILRACGVPILSRYRLDADQNPGSLV